MVPAFVRGWVLLTWACLAFAGCAAPTANQEGGRDGAEDADLPDTLAIDLRDSLLDITMPEGQPTMLVALNVTKDMWVRPRLGTGAGADPIAAPIGEHAEYWVLCPWARSFGLPDGHWYHGVPFWLEDATLTLASERIPLPPGTDGLRDDSGGVCLTKAYGPDRWSAVAADEPRDGVLVLLLAVNGIPERFPREEPAAPTPEWRLLVGIASEACPASTDGAAPFCPPTPETRAQPLARAGLALYAGADLDCPEPCVGDEEDDTPPCPEACGFTVEDGRMRAANVPLTGRVELSRVTDTARGLAYALASAASAPFQASLRAGSTEASGACDTPVDNQAVQILLAHDEPAELRMSVDFAKPNLVGFGAFLVEIPLDLAHIGLSFAPSGEGTWFAGTVPMACG